VSKLQGRFNLLVDTICQGREIADLRSQSSMFMAKLPEIIGKTLNAPNGAAPIGGMATSTISSGRSVCPEIGFSTRPDEGPVGRA